MWLLDPLGHRRRGRATLEAWDHAEDEEPDDEERERERERKKPGRWGLIIF